MEVSKRGQIKIEFNQKLRRRNGRRDLAIRDDKDLFIMTYIPDDPEDTVQEFDY